MTSPFKILLLFIAAFLGVLPIYAASKRPVELSICRYELSWIRNTVLADTDIYSADSTETCFSQALLFQQVLIRDNQFLLFFVGLESSKTNIQFKNGEVYFFKSPWGTPLAVYAEKHSRLLLSDFVRKIGSIKGEQTQKQRVPASETVATMTTGSTCSDCNKDHNLAAMQATAELSLTAHAVLTVKSCTFTAMQSAKDAFATQVDLKLGSPADFEKWLASAVSQYKSLQDLMQSLPQHFSEIGDILSGLGPELVTELGCAIGGEFIMPMLMTAMTGGTASAKIGVQILSLVQRLQKLKSYFKMIKGAQKLGLGAGDLSPFLRLGLSCAK